MNKHRWILILDRLNDTEYITSEELAKELNLSSKTIRKELKVLKSVLEKAGARLYSKTKLGYSLRVIDEEIYNNFLISLQKNDSIPETVEARIHYLLEMLLIKDDYIKLDDLCDQIYMSRSSLTSCLKEVRRILGNYHLKLINRPRYGIKVEGNEFDFRLCIASYMEQNYEQNEELRKKYLERIEKCIQAVLTDSNIRISEVSYQNLLVHIYIVLERIRNGCYLQADNGITMIEKESEFICALHIADLLTKEFDVKIPDSEISYIAIHLASKRIIEETTINNGFVISQEIYDMVTHMLDEIQSSYNIDLHDDLELRMVLAMHLVPFKVRLKYNLNLKNPLLREIKASYTLAYMIAISASEVLNKHYHKAIREDEIGYLALHFNLALERMNKSVNRKNIVVVCSTGRGTAQILLWKIKEEFNRYVNKIIICDVSQMKDMKLDDIDYVFTTVKIPFSINRPVLQIQLFLDNKDRKAIQRILNDSYPSVLSNYFDPRLFLSNVEADEKTQVIEQMAERISQVICLPDSFLDLVYEREKMGVTAFGNLVAIPHPNKAIVDETFVCIAILKRPVQWDEHKVQFVLMFALKKQNNDNMQYFSKVISRLLFNKRYINELIHKAEFPRLIEILNLIEKEINEEHGG